MKMHAAQLTFDGTEEAATQETGGFLQFMRVSSEEGGLLSPSQAAVVLEVSPQRVAELVKLGQLRKWDLLGKSYVSVRDVDARRKTELKAGRPVRAMGQRLKVAAKVLRENDSAQWAATATFSD
jgi:hypothetical protein